MSSSGRYRVVGVLPESALADVRPGTVFERMAFDLRARVLLEAVPGGFVVRHEGFKKIGWEWRETDEARHSYDAEEWDLACRYFNSLLLSPGYRGTSRFDLIPSAGE